MILPTQVSRMDKFIDTEIRAGGEEVANYRLKSVLILSKMKHKVLGTGGGDDSTARPLE